MFQEFDLIQKIRCFKPDPHILLADHIVWSLFPHLTNSYLDCSEEEFSSV